MLCCALVASAQLRSDSVRVYFRQNQSVLDMYYLDNAKDFARMAELYRLYSRYPQYWLKGSASFLPLHPKRSSLTILICPNAVPVR